MIAKYGDMEKKIYIYRTNKSAIKDNCEDWCYVSTRKLHKTKNGMDIHRPQGPFETYNVVDTEVLKKMKIPYPRMFYIKEVMLDIDKIAKLLNY